jgi:Fe-S-cluster-containing hydrogenase component 2
MIQVISDRCTGCGTCAEMCPADAITMEGEFPQLDRSLCTECEVCVSVCPQSALVVSDSQKRVPANSSSSEPSRTVRAEVVREGPDEKPIRVKPSEVIVREEESDRSLAEVAKNAVRHLADIVGPLAIDYLRKSQDSSGQGGRGGGRGSGKGKGKRGRSRGKRGGRNRRR